MSEPIKLDYAPREKHTGRIARAIAGSLMAIATSWAGFGIADYMKYASAPRQVSYGPGGNFFLLSQTGYYKTRKESFEKMFGKELLISIEKNPGICKFFEEVSPFEGRNPKEAIPVALGAGLGAGTYLILGRKRK